MIKLSEFKLPKEEILQDEKFRKLCNENNIVHLSWDKFNKYKHKNIKRIKRGRRIIETSKFEDKYFFFRLNDFPVNKEIFDKYYTENSTWYIMNCEVDHPKLIPVPLGVTDTSWCSLIGDLDIIEEFNTTERKYKNLAYINFNTDRKDQGLPDRLEIKKLFGDKNWTTNDKFQRDKKGHRNFINNIYNHKFVFCPRGNGVDTHRLWMSLYLGTIPIVKDHITHHKFKHLPILFIEKWEDINEDYLNQKFEEFHAKEYDMSILRMSYWENKFLDNCL